LNLKRGSADLLAQEGAGSASVNEKQVPTADKASLARGSNAAELLLLEATTPELMEQKRDEVLAFIRS
jgi:hypothetical protein